MNLKEFNYKTSQKSDSVVVLGAGPSLPHNIKRIKAYIKKNKSLVFASNYNFKKTLGISSNYTYMTDLVKFKSEVFSINSNLILPSELLAIINPKTLDRVREKLNVFRIGSENQRHVYECKKALVVGVGGELPYRAFGISGLGTMLVSALCKPKTMLIAGLDDPKPNKNHKIMYNGDYVKYNKPKKIIKVMNYFEKSLIPTISNMGIKIETFKDVGLFGLNKSKLNIKII